MKIEKQFNKRAAELVEVQSPLIHQGPQYALGVKVTFVRVTNDIDRSTIAMHMTPDEALGFAVQLLQAVQRLTK
jgi:hypothetical protein